MTTGWRCSLSTLDLGPVVLSSETACRRWKNPSIDKTEFWVVEEEQEGELDYEELEEELEELPIHGQCSNSEQLEDNEDEAEDVDLETFQRRNFFNDEDDDWH
ncbi:unnamed protein product [Coffea canephora]|uniref:Uncharacterized protein n=1 Tax=Coffea canephora TaxID=49390 RepID=A0A068UJM0_COFCA|nr:unnamed protein product [Coffea canephora]